MLASSTRSPEGVTSQWLTLLHELVRCGQRTHSLNDILFNAAEVVRLHLPAHACEAHRVLGIDDHWVHSHLIGGRGLAGSAERHDKSDKLSRAAIEQAVLVEPGESGGFDVWLPVSRSGCTVAVLALRAVVGAAKGPELSEMFQTIQLQLSWMTERGGSRLVPLGGNVPELDFLNALLENLPVGILVYDAQDAPELRIVSVNAHAEMEFGIRREVVSGMTLTQAFGRRIAETVRLPIARALAEPGMVEESFATGEGDTTRYVNVRHLAVRNADGQPVWLVAVLRDITLERVAERDLQESERRFRGFAESMDEVLFVTNPDRTVFDFLSSPVDDQWSDMRGGLSAGALTFLAQMHPEDRVLMRERREAELRLEPTDISYRTDHAELGMRWLRSRTRSRRMPDGAVRVYGVVSDVTAERQRQDDLRAARDAAESASLAKSQFMANMSHEIRTPMNGILGMTELLLGTSLSDKQRRFVQAVYRSGESLLEIINDILDFSKIEAGRLDLAQVDFGIRALAEDTLELLAPRAQEKGLELSYREAAGMPSVLQGDPLRLRQVLTNLIANAIKFTEQGEVVVEVRQLESGPQPRFEFVVRDTGIGIEAQILPKLFSAFMQGSVGMSRRYGGTGLGLTISKQLVELMGGNIRVHSAPGQGSQFVFELPLGVSHEGEEDSADVTLLPMPDLRVLVVDDMETNRVVLDNMLRAWGMQVELARDGQQALEILQGHTAVDPNFDLALIDMHMPLLDGVELARALQSTELPQPPKMILLSSLSSHDEVKVAHEVGYHRLVAKPIRKAELRQAILGVTSSRGGPGETRPKVSAHVLVVEDNVVNQEVIGQMLRGLGCRVHVSSSGLAGLRALCDKRFDLVLMDIQMPGMDGVEALTWFRQGQTRRFMFVTPAQTPVIAVTANALEGDEQRFLGLGFDGYLSKPFRQSQLFAMLTRHLRPQAPEETSSGTSGQSMAEPGMSQTPNLPSEVTEVLDVQALNRLRELDPTGENRLMERVVGAFETSVARLMPQLDEAMQSEEMSGIRHVSHTLKSSSASMGAVKLSKMCSDIETMARLGQTDGMAERVAQLQAEVEVVRVALNRMLNA